MTSTLRACALVVLGAAPLLSQPSEKPWSLRVSEAVIARTPQTTARWDYTAGVVLGAIQRVGESRHDARLLDYVKRNMDRWIKPDGTIDGYKMEEFNLDQIAQGRVLFSLQPKVARYRKAADLLREQLRRQPRTAEGGFWHKQIYPQQMWLDGLFMAEPFYAQYAATFNEPHAFDDVAKQFLLMARHARDPRTGLMYHAWDAARKQPWADSVTGVSPQFWGRAMGWYLVGLVETLDVFPLTHKDRVGLVHVLRDAVDAVARVQDPVSGMWWQILDQPNRAGNYLETSASSMFTYAIAKAARRGYIDPTYRQIAQRAFDGILRQAVSVGTDGLVTIGGINQVAGLGGSPRADGAVRDGTFRYYVTEPVVSDDFKGVGPFILAAHELGR